MIFHSPGPYSVVRGRQKHREAMFIKSGADFIGKVYGHDGQPTEANAKLWQAAPTMYLACKMVADAYDGDGDMYEAALMCKKACREAEMPVYRGYNPTRQ